MKFKHLFLQRAVTLQPKCFLSIDNVINFRIFDQDEIYRFVRIIQWRNIYLKVNRPKSFIIKSKFRTKQQIKWKNSNL